LASLAVGANAVFTVVPVEGATVRFADAARTVSAPLLEAAPQRAVVPLPHHKPAAAQPPSAPTSSNPPPVPQSSGAKTPKSGADQQQAQQTLAAPASQSVAAPQPDPIKQQVDAVAPTNDQLGTWINQALQVLVANGYPLGRMNPDDIRTIIEHESGGNPSAVNNSDSNAAQGTPSKGLMQIIDPTFRTWALPGHTNIYDPVDNIITGVRYSLSTYGSLSKVPGVSGVRSGGTYQGY
jgi:soluble lytic murein transglycosylase-like protein